MYVKNLLRLSESLPMLRSSLFECIIDRLIAIDRAVTPLILLQQQQSEPIASGHALHPIAAATLKQLSTPLITAILESSQLDLRLKRQHVHQIVILEQCLSLLYDYFELFRGPLRFLHLQQRQSTVPSSDSMIQQLSSSLLLSLCNLYDQQLSVSIASNSCAPYLVYFYTSLSPSYLDAFLQHQHVRCLSSSLSAMHRLTALNSLIGFLIRHQRISTPTLLHFLGVQLRFCTEFLRAQNDEEITVSDELRCIFFKVAQAVRTYNSRTSQLIPSISLLLTKHSRSASF